MKKESLKQQVMKNAFWNFFANLINRMGALIFTIILARILLPEAFGIYNLALAVAIISITLANLGINSALVRYVSSAVKDRKKAASYFRYLFKIKSILTFFIAFLIIILSKPLAIYIFNKPSLIYPLLFSSTYLIFLSFESFFTSLFYAFKNVKTISIKEAFSNILKILFVIILFYFLSSKFYVIAAISSMSMAFLFSIIFMIYIISQKYSFIFKKTDVQINRKRILNFLFYISMGSISVILFSYIDSFMLGIFIADASFVGFYRAAFSIVFSIGALLCFSNVLYPVFTQLKKINIQQAFNKSLKYLSIIVIPSVFGLIIFSKYIVRLIFGYEYLTAAIPLYILSFLILEMTIGHLFSVLLSAREKLKLFVKFIIFAIILNIILDYFAIIIFRRYSLTLVLLGVAIATVISRFSYFIALYFIVKKELKIKIFLRNFINPLIASIIFSAILFYFNLIFIKDMNLWIGITEVLAGILIYFSLLFLFKEISIQEIKTIFKKIPKR